MWPRGTSSTNCMRLLDGQPKQCHVLHGMGESAATISRAVERGRTPDGGLPLTHRPR